MLLYHCALQNASVAVNLNRKLSSTRLILFDLVFGSSREIIKNVLFFREIASLVPFFAELATASNVCHHVNAAAIEPKPPRKIKTGRHADSVAAVRVEQRRIVSVALHSFSIKDVQWNFRAVF